MTSDEIRHVVQESIEDVNESISTTDGRQQAFFALLILAVGELAAQVAELNENITKPAKGYGPD